ncbi:response regulator [Dongia soli]|uniref:Response regulator n=1 Tax=Dongia soli TaxID=600628 RepID=A0ABU5E624_9PROT|nr:response regulator [Dongia soli]MDY0881621.1 response regulator [Dongia soli]
MKSGHDLSETIVANVRYLRRYARALLGSQKSGDMYVRLCLETILNQPSVISADDDVHVQLFKLFHDVWRMTPGATSDAPAGTEVSPDHSIQARLDALPPTERQVLLLTVLEKFSTSDVAAILGISETEVVDLLRDAWDTVKKQLSTSILVIEDEPVIAFDICSLVTEMGHKIAGTTSNQAEAIALAAARKPGLILADINLGAGGSGLTAVTEILASSDVPVIFITAYPELLLTGDRPEPTYLVTKPFEPDTLRVTITQALSNRSSNQSGNGPDRQAAG